MSNFIEAVSDTKQHHAETVAIKMGALATLVRCAASHIEDIESGIEEGLYSKAENLDLAAKQAALDEVQSLLRSRQRSETVKDRDVRYTVLVHGIELARGDAGTIGIMFGNLSGENFTHRVGHDQTHEQWLAYFASVSDMALALGAPIEARNPEGKTLLTGAIGHALIGNSLSDLYAKWDQLSDVAIDEEGAIDEPFLHFSKGTPREEIWAWFERRNPKFVVAELQRGIRRSDEEAVTSEGGPDGRTHELYIKIAADSIATLRKVDVFRVIESVRPDNIDGVSRASLSRWISAQRPDLSEEVADVLQELAN